MRRVKDVVLFCINARSEIEFIKTIKNNIKIHNQGSVAWPLENDKLARVALAKRPFYTIHPLPPPTPPPPHPPEIPKSRPHCGDASMGSRNISSVTWRPGWHTAGLDVGAGGSRHRAMIVFQRRCWARISLQICAVSGQPVYSSSENYFWRVKHRKIQYFLRKKAYR